MTTGHGQSIQVSALCDSSLLQPLFKNTTHEKNWNHYFKVFSLCVLCCISFSTFSYCGRPGASTHQLHFHERKTATFYTNSSEFTVTFGEQKYSSDSDEFEIIEVKYQLLKQKISYGTKRKNCWVLAELFGHDVAATLPSCWHSRE